MAAFIYPLWNASPVLRTALRVRTVRVMAIDSEQDAHTRHVGTAWRTQSDGAAGAVKAARPHGRSKRAFDLSHQTLAAWPETRRGSAETGGRTAGAWRSGAGSRRGPDSGCCFWFWPSMCSSCCTGGEEQQEREKWRAAVHKWKNGIWC